VSPLWLRLQAEVEGPLALLGVAAELFLSVETVKTHVRNVLAKLGARTRVQAVITAYESGFIR
jgi:DNA-binding NarL/FixJ family response regulator